LACACAHRMQIGLTKGESLLKGAKSVEKEPEGG
jgi:hypothetical protein